LAISGSEGFDGMSEPTRNHERAHYRLWYPQADRPTLEVGDQKFEVSEISEEGARIVLSRPFGHDRDEPFTGVLQFSNGESDPVEGVVLRSTQDEVVANLTSGVTLKRMMSEQIRIRQKYPTTLRSSEDSSGKASR
jgi:hypothetical protein